MTKLDWEKQNRTELVRKRLNQCFDDSSHGSSEDEALLRASGFLPSIEGIDAVSSTRTEYIKEWQRLRRVLERKNSGNHPSNCPITDFLRSELKQIYVNLLVIRLLATHPERLSENPSL